MSARTGLLAIAAFIGMTASAFALPITGAFSITGVTSPINAGVTINMASGLSFAANNNVVTTFVPGNSGTVMGNLASCFTACGTINNITSFASVATTPIAPLFTLNNGLSFDLTGLESVVRTAASANTLAGLDVNGLGVYHLAGYSDTAGEFKITTQGNSFVVTFSASGQAIPIAEPASMAVLGGSLAMLGLIRRRRSAPR